MEHRLLGNSNIKIAPLIFGGNVFGWTIDQKKSFEILDAFIGHGFNCIDTADMYSNWVPGNSGGESETIIGKWLAQRGKRDDVVIATKVGMNMNNQKGLKKDYIIKSVEDSLRRLQTDYIDLYQAHQDDLETNLEETLGAFHSLIQAGKVRLIGASNYSADRLAKAMAIAQEQNLIGYQSYQPGYNLYDRQKFEEASEKVCLDNKLSVISYYSLASGFLTGKYRTESDVSKSPRGPGIKGQYMNERGNKILKVLDEISSEQGASPAQVALAWLLHRPSVTAPIVSATGIEQLEMVLKAPQLKLNSSQLDRLNLASEWR